MTIQNSDFTQNAVPTTIFDDGPSATLNVTNSTIAGNTGSIAIDAQGPTTLVNDTITGNNTGVFNDGGAVTADNDIIALNTSGVGHTDCNGAVAANDHSIDSDSSCGVTTHGTSATLKLGTPGFNGGGSTQTAALGGSSIAIDAGDNAVCPSIDQIYQARSANATNPCDAGAYESQKNADSATTSLLPSSTIVAGASAHDSTTLSGLFNAATTTGTVTYGVYTDNRAPRRRRRDSSRASRP